VNLTVAIVAPPTIALLAWALWLLFNAIIARWYGPDGLKSTPQIARVFRPRQWLSVDHEPPHEEQHDPALNNDFPDTAPERLTGWQDGQSR
jgi:hypothetical protein